MEKHIKDAMNESILEQACPHYGVDFSQVKRLGGFENFIYEYELEGSEFVMRFVHSTHRSFEFVFAELEFIDYLSKNGANVSVVVPTLAHQFLFKVKTIDDEYFSVCVFTKAPGTYVDKNAIDEEFLHNYGRTVGKLHSLTKSYKPKHKRYQWNEEDFIEIGRRNLPEDKKFILQIAIDHVRKIEKYATSINDYGLIHTDLHFGNMYFDGETLTIFDWDDSSYKHFISDIAIIIFYFYGISSLSDDEIEDKSIWFLKHFMKGYNTENQLDRIWFERLNDFFKLREIILYIVLYAAGDEMLNSRWSKMYIAKFEQRIIQGKDFFDLKKVLRELWNL